MINPNVNVNPPVNNMYARSNELYVDVSPPEREELIASLKFLAPKLQSFVVTFYESFLEKQTLNFIQNNNKESLINMLSASLNLIISSIQQPLPLDDYINILTTNYPSFPSMIKNKDLFVRSFMNAVVYSFKGNYTERLGNLWYKAVTSFVTSVEPYIHLANR